MSTPTIIFHESALRLVKGIVSAWEKWLKSIKQLSNEPKKLNQ